MGGAAGRAGGPASECRDSERAGTWGWRGEVSGRLLHHYSIGGAIKEGEDGDPPGLSLRW